MRETIEAAGQPGSATLQSTGSLQADAAAVAYGGDQCRLV
jgi:hypothetical protein